MSNMLLGIMGALKGTTVINPIFVDGGPDVGSPDVYSDNTPGNSSIQLNFNSNGTASVTGTSLTTVNLTTWATPTSLAPGTYEIRAALMSGATLDINSGLNTWLNLTANHSWGYIRASGSSTGVLRIEIKNATGPVLSTGYFQLSAVAF